MDTSLMQPVSNIVQHLPVGAIIYHQPRNHYYRVLNKTMIKKDGGGWEYGWSYQEVKKHETVSEDGGFVGIPNTEVYSRAFSLFDSDWFLAY